MNEVLYMDKGRVMVPKPYRQRHNLADDSMLLAVETKSGAMVLRPLKGRPELNLIDHLLRFKGVEIPERKHICPPRV